MIQFFIINTFYYFIDLFPRYVSSGRSSLSDFYNPEEMFINLSAIIACAFAPITGGFGSNGPPFIYDPIRRFFQYSLSLRQNKVIYYHVLVTIITTIHVIHTTRPI